MGRCAIDHYKDVKRYSVFSHDELICKLASECQYLDPAIGDATKFELDCIVQQEKHSRKLAYEHVSAGCSAGECDVECVFLRRERRMVIEFALN